MGSHGPSGAAALWTRDPIAPGTGRHRTVTWPAPSSAVRSAGAGRAREPAAAVPAVRRPARSSQSLRALLSASGELLHADQRTDGALDLAREVRLERVSGEVVGDGRHDHPLVEREVVARDLA